MTITKDQADAMQASVDARRPSTDQMVEAIKRVHLVMKTNEFVIDIDPIGAPRQSRRDAWAPTPAVVRYRAWKDRFVLSCQMWGWKLQPTFHAEFQVAMPPSWSKKKKAAMLGQLHQQKPDIDNMVKACLDAFGIDDGFVATLQVTKRWTDKGRIILYF